MQKGNATVLAGNYM